MEPLAPRRRAALQTVADALTAVGANLTIAAPGERPIAVGAQPELARVSFRDAGAIDALARRDHLALAEAYLGERVDVDGDMREVIKVTEVLALDESRLGRLRFAAALALRGRRALARESVALHYDRPPEFFLPWFERWRSYSHGLYATPDDDPSAAQARKLQAAIDALELRPGMRVLDVGAGWGSFIEYAGLRGIRVHGLTISREQQRFVAELIRERELPCTIELVDFFAYRPAEPLDGAVFMGSFEHVLDYARAARFLAAQLRPGARVWADFCAAREVVAGRGSRFMRKWIWPGNVNYVDVPALLRALLEAGLEVQSLNADTLSYAWTVRDWARALERSRKPLAARFGEPAVRAFLLFLWGSHHFLAKGWTQAYHLVAATRAQSALAPSLDTQARR